MSTSVERMTLNACGLFDAGHLQPGITLAQAADILWAYSSPEMYELLVLHCGMASATLPPFRGTGPDRRTATAAVVRDRKAVGADQGVAE